MLGTGVKELQRMVSNVAICRRITFCHNDRQQGVTRKHSKGAVKACVDGGPVRAVCPDDALCFGLPRRRLITVEVIGAGFRDFAIAVPHDGAADLMSVPVVRAGRHVVEPLVPRGTAIAVIVIDDELVDNEEEAKGVAGSPRRAVAAAMVLGFRPVRFMLRPSGTSLSHVQRQSYMSKQESAFG